MLEKHTVVLASMKEEEGLLVNNVAPDGMSNLFWQRVTFVVVGCMCKKNKHWYT
jgi:hypothetical protein